MLVMLKDLKISQKGLESSPTFLYLIVPVITFSLEQLKTRRVGPVDNRPTPLRLPMEVMPSL